VLVVALAMAVAGKADRADWFEVVWMVWQSRLVCFGRWEWTNARTSTACHVPMDS
jgi:hypothetical protein